MIGQLDFVAHFLMSMQMHANFAEFLLLHRIQYIKNTKETSKNDRLCI